MDLLKLQIPDMSISQVFIPFLESIERFQKGVRQDGFSHAPMALDRSRSYVGNLRFSPLKRGKGCSRVAGK
jgi:hypothetical protein